MKSLHKHIDASCLPSNYGGKLPEIDYASKDWYPILKSIEDTIKGSIWFSVPRQSNNFLFYRKQHLWISI